MTQRKKAAPKKSVTKATEATAPTSVDTKVSTEDIRKTFDRKTMFINPVEKASVQNRHKQSFVNGRGVIMAPMNKFKEYNTEAHLRFLPDRKRPGYLKTGMDKLVENKFYGADPQEVLQEFGLSMDWYDHMQYIVEQKQIPLQRELEIRHGRNPDDYTDRIGYMSTLVNLDDKNTPLPKKTFLQKVVLSLKPEPTPLTSDDPMDEIYMLIAENEPVVANDYSRLNTSIHDWYISEEEATLGMNDRKRNLIEEATAMLFKLKREMGDFKTYQIAISLTDRAGHSIFRGANSPKHVNSLLSEFISEKNKNCERNCHHFLDAYEDLQENANWFQIKYLVRQALNQNIIARRDMRYYWMSKYDKADVYDLGTDIEKVYAFFAKEYDLFNGDDNINNWYIELVKELKQQNIRID